MMGSRYNFYLKMEDGCILPVKFHAYRNNTCYFSFEKQWFVLHCGIRDIETTIYVDNSIDWLKIQTFPKGIPLTKDLLDSVLKTWNSIKGKQELKNKFQKRLLI